MTIPQEITLGALKFKIVFDDDLCIKKDMFGEINHHTHTIVLSKKSERGDLTHEFIQQTLLHELTHAILEIMQERKLNDNEKFVNTFSTFSNQIITQVK